MKRPKRTFTLDERELVFELWKAMFPLTVVECEIACFH